MFQRVTQAIRWKFGRVSSVLDLVLASALEDLGNLDVEETICKSNHAIIRMRLSLQGLVANKKYDGTSEE